MKKINISIPEEDFGTLNTKYPADSSKVGNDEFTTGTKNLETSVNGMITKRKGGVIYSTLPNPPRDQYEAIFSDGVRHLLTVDSGNVRFSSGDGIENLVISGMSAGLNFEFATTQDRVYFGNGIQKKVYDRITNYGGVNYLPVTITVVDYTQLAGDTITLGTTTKTEGIDWTAAIDNMNTAETIKNALNTISGITATRPSSSNIVTVHATSTLPIIVSDATNTLVTLLSYGRIKDMGAQAPLTAPTFAADSAGGSVPVGNHTYKVTFVYYDSEESNGSPSSAVHTVSAPNQTVNLTGIPIGGYGVTQRKIYRDNSDGVYTFIGTVTNNTATTFTDSLASGLTPLPEDQDLPEDFTLISVYLDKLFLAGVSGDPYTIFYSVTGMPDIFPVSNYLTCNQEDPITGIVVYLDRLIVFNRRSMGQILGKTSDQFRYADIQGSVGCVDTRSIQIRVIDGVPVLVWLSDKGFYAYNGNSVVYISDVIEDQVNSNIQQAVIQKNRISHSDYATFTSGTKSDGINLEANPGTITTKGPYWDTVAHPGATYEEQTNPKKIFDTESEWENGTTQTNIVTIDTNDITVPTRLHHDVFFRLNIQTGIISDVAGTLSGSYNANGVVAFPYINYTTIGTNQSSELTSFSSLPGTTFTVLDSEPSVDWAQRFYIYRSGLLQNVTLRLRNWVSPSATFRIVVRADNSGIPGSVIAQSGVLTAPGNSTGSYSHTFNLSMTVGNYFIGIVSVTELGALKPLFGPNSDILLFPTPSSYRPLHNTGLNPTVWTGIVPPVSSSFIDYKMAISFTFQSSAIPKTAQFISNTYDTKTTNCIVDDLTISGSYPSGTFPSGPYSTSANIVVEGTDTITPAFVAEISQSVNNLNGTTAISLSNKRYWRVRYELSTTDDRASVTISPPTLTFNTQGTWDSEVIDCTSDVSTYSTPIVTKTEPSGTSIALEIATSVSSTGPWGGSGNGDGQFGSFGSHVIRQYVKLRAILTTNLTNTSSPTLRSLEFKWTIGNGTTTSYFISSAIDTGVTPAGWDLFQASYNTNGGVVQFSLRSSATQVGLSSATWYSVANGEFPTSSLQNLQWIQWRAIIQSNPDQVPTISSVTIGWFVGTTSDVIRCASIFYNKNYYVALAEFENEYNNILFVLDFEGKWRVFRDLNIATLSYFFNNPYFGDAVTNKIVRFLEGTSDQGNSIELEVHTKAFEGSTQWVDNDDKIKILDHVVINCTNTGATYDCWYSVDEGSTFYELYDTSGNNSWTTLTDGKEVFKYLRPRYTVTIPQGRTLLFKVHNNDTKEVQIKAIKASAFVREQPPIITG